MEGIKFPPPDLNDIVFDCDPPTAEQKMVHLTLLSTELVERLRLHGGGDIWGAGLMGAFLNLSKYLKYLKELELRK